MARFISILSAFTSFTLSFFFRKKKIDLVIDTDVDTDDMMAIAFLLNEPSVNLVAITTSGVGMAQFDCSAPNILNLLQLLGSPHIPVTYGAKEALSPYSNFPQDWRKAVDTIYGIPLPKSPINPQILSSSEMIIKQVKTAQSRNKKIHLLCLGPLTNIAIALTKDKSIATGIEKIVMMGGAIDGLGNVVGKDFGKAHPNSEYNIYLDALAAEKVFSSGIPVELIPLKATDSVPMDREFIEKLEGIAKTTAARFVAQVSASFVKSQPTVDVYYWDPLAAVILVDPTVGLNKKTMKIKINLQKESDLYGSIEEIADGAPISVYLGADGEKFYDRFTKSLNRK